MLVIRAQFGKTPESTREQQLVFEKNHNYLNVSHSFVQSQEYLLILLIFKGHILANPICNYSCDWKKFLGTHKFCLPTLQKRIRILLNVCSFVDHWHSICYGFCVVPSL